MASELQKPEEPSKPWWMRASKWYESDTYQGYERALAQYNRQVQDALEAQGEIEKAASERAKAEAEASKRAAEKAKAQADAAKATAGAATQKAKASVGELQGQLSAVASSPLARAGIGGVEIGRAHV